MQANHEQFHTVKAEFDRLINTRCDAQDKAIRLYGIKSREADHAGYAVHQAVVALRQWERNGAQFKTQGV